MLKNILIAITLSSFSIAAFAEQPFICDTKTHTVMIDYINSSFQYRSWKKPKSVQSAPSLLISSGKVDSEGTGPCRHSIWTFTNDGVEYRVEELGCGGESDPPKDAIAQLFITAPDKSYEPQWCFKK